MSKINIEEYIELTKGYDIGFDLTEENIKALGTHYFKFEPYKYYDKFFYRAGQNLLSWVDISKSIGVGINTLNRWKKIDKTLEDCYRKGSSSRIEDAEKLLDDMVFGRIASSETIYFNYDEKGEEVRSNGMRTTKYDSKVILDYLKVHKPDVYNTDAEAKVLMMLAERNREVLKYLKDMSDEELRLIEVIKLNELSDSELIILFSFIDELIKGRGESNGI